MKIITWKPKKRAALLAAVACDYLARAEEPEGE